MATLIDYDVLKSQMEGQTVPKPLSGTLSGHAAGEPFDKLVYKKLKNDYPHIYRQYEFLNELFLAHPEATSYEDRCNLITSPTASLLLRRGCSAVENWTPSNLLEEKQNDTADILHVDGDTYQIIDVKTRNISKKAQAPNIISAKKLAQMCASILDNGDSEKLSIDYFEVDWKSNGPDLVCKDCHHADLFKADPAKLYINWAAAMQIQFHVVDCDQSFHGSKNEWAQHYLRAFTNSAKERAQKMIDYYVITYEKYI